MRTTVDTAHYLTARGKKVTIVSDESEEAFGAGQSMMLDKFVEPVFLAAGGSVRSESKLKSVGDGEVVLTTSFGVDITVPCDCVVDASNMVPTLRWPMNFRRFRRCGRGLLPDPVEHSKRHYHREPCGASLLMHS